MNNIVIIDDYLSNDYACEISSIIKDLEYKSACSTADDVNYSLGAATEETTSVISKVFSNSAFFNLVNLMLETDVSAIYESYISQMSRKDYISWHLDKNDNNQNVTFLYYLTTYSDQKDGGTLEFAKGISITPKFNRLVLFPNQKDYLHQVTPINTSKLRHVITGWLYNDRDKNNN
tara:strand:+ start:1589 stop:2116 length:528 start_codon:yes stop_codon:yes gene_type:complete